ncbi:MAG TPA: SDR family oxidoreductase [Pyrinomonadaceae bacterium]|jgi:short-subunit dehydrogenase|nr:SDR family oxidoreductase [Pyrinomonadaceae bacterium]
MKVKLKKLSEQVIVITGASSGIGLVTARMAARRGAKLVLAARDEGALRQVAGELNASGHEAVYVAADVTKLEEVRRIADAAVGRFGGFDTWVNNAAVSIYGRVLEVPLEDHRQIFETNYWGLVHGTLVAVEHLKRRGGALIQIGSALSDRAIPLQGTYCATKHAVKGFTDALRMELEEQRAPVSVTLIKPSSIDTPYRQHARNLMEVEPLNPPPVYAPETVAEAILHSATHPERDVFIGAGGKFLSVAGERAPRLTDKAMEAVIFDLQRSDQPKPVNRKDSLYGPSGDGHERGGYPGYVAETSLYTRASLHPLLFSAGALVAGLGLALLWRGRNIASDNRGRGVLREGWGAEGRTISLPNKVQDASNTTDSRAVSK